MSATSVRWRAVNWAEHHELIAFLTVFAVAAAVFVLVTLSLVIGLGRHFGRITCTTFAEQTGRPTKFVIYNRFATGACLTPTAGGKWIPTKNLREFGEAL